MTASHRHGTPELTGRAGPHRTVRTVVAATAAAVLLATGVGACASGPQRTDPAARSAGGTDAPSPGDGLPLDAGGEPTTGNGVPGPADGAPEVAEVGAADGVLPSGVSPFDTDVPALANLDPDLLRAVQRASVDAQSRGIDLLVTTGWRSVAYQQQLFDEAVSTYGEEEARRRVASPDTSRHVTGDAVDIGPTDADSWLSQHGAEHGLCQTYANEIWHFELVTTPGGDCPAMRADATVG